MSQHLKSYSEFIFGSPPVYCVGHNATSVTQWAFKSCPHLRMYKFRGYVHDQKLSDVRMQFTAVFSMEFKVGNVYDT